MPTKNNTTLNLPTNVLESACYIPWIGTVVSIVVLLLEKSPEPRWHATHALVIALSLFVLGMVIFPLASFLMMAGLVIQIYAVVKVYRGEKVRFWKVSEWADKVAEKLKM